MHGLFYLHCAARHFSAILENNAVHVGTDQKSEKGSEICQTAMKLLFLLSDCRCAADMLFQFNMPVV